MRLEPDTFTYDHENRLIEAVVGGVTSTSTYNGDGLRVSLEVDDGVNPPVTTDYVWDVNRRLPVVLDDGTNRYVYGLDLVAAIDGTDDATYFLYDGLGSTTELLDEAGDATDAYTYDVFGAIRASTGSSANPWLFTGEQHDVDSGLYYLRARYYDSATGRFLSQDPYGGVLSWPQTQEPYSYTASNPVNRIDPSGLYFVLGPAASQPSKEGGFGPTPTATPPATPGPLIPEPAATPVAPPGYVPPLPGDPFFGISFSCCRDPFELLTGKGINHWLGCWAAQLEWANALLLDATLAVVSGEPLPLYYQLPSAADTTKKYAEAQKKCDA